MATGQETTAAARPLHAKNETLNVENASDKLASTIDRLSEVQKVADELLLRLNGPTPTSADLGADDARAGGSLSHLHDRADTVSRAVDRLYNVISQINDAV